MKLSQLLLRGPGPLLLAVLSLLPACNEDVLEQVNPNVVTPGTFYRNADDARRLVIGAYSPFTNILYYTRMNVFATDYRDDIVNGFGTSERTDPGRFAAESNKNMVIWSWQVMFQGVSRANVILQEVPGIEMDDTDKARILAEAKFIRAYNYFQLLQNYRNVPLITQPLTLEETRTITQAPPQAVYDQIVTDLREAAAELPASWDAANVGRATAGAARGLLGRVMLSNGDFGGARDVLRTVIESGTYRLVDDFADNFEEASENNSESLFEIQLVADGNQGWGGDAPGLGKGAAYMQDYAPPPVFTGQDGFRINEWALDLMLDERTVNDEIDPRAFITFFWDTDETTEYAGRTLAATHYQGATYDEVYPDGGFIYAKKNLDIEAGYATAAQGWHFSGNNVRVLRYADVLLMFAEAELMTNGSTPAALEAINAVRARADMPPFTTITVEDIEDERVKELALERIRYYDLLRWGQIEEKIVNRPGVKSGSGGTGAYRPGREYFDIPQVELNNNQNFEHNPGYDG